MNFNQVRRGQGYPGPRGHWNSPHPGRGASGPGRGRGESIFMQDRSLTVDARIRDGSSRGRGQGNPGPRGQWHSPHPGRGASGPSRGRGESIFMQDRSLTVDARIRDGSDKALVAELNRTNSPGSGAQGLPLRPDFGTQGREISLRVNHFPVQVKGRIYRYTAAIALVDKRKITRTVKRRVFDLAEQTVDWQQAGMSGRVAHDSAERLVASFELPQPLTIRGVYRDEGENGTAGGGTGYELTLTFEEEVDQEMLNECLRGTPVDSQALAKVLSALNLVLTAHPSQIGFKMGRNDDEKKHPDQRIFFDTPEPKDIGGGLTVRQGFYLSVRPAHQQLMVNVNTCHAAFYKPQNFVDAMNEYSQFVGNTNAFGDGVRVNVRPTNRVVMIKCISNKNSRQRSFKHKQYGIVTVEQYYEKHHGIKLTKPDLLLLEDFNGNHYPQELCDILPNVGFKGELVHGMHATAMLNQACKLPKENAEEIVNRGLDKLGFRHPNPVLESFGINVGTDMAVVPGRVLKKPGLSYSSHSSANIDDRASWNLRNLKFAVGAQLDKLAVLVVQDGGQSDFAGAKDPQLRKIVDDFRAMCIKCGMRVHPVDESAYVQVQLPRPTRQDRAANPFREDAIREMEKTLKSLVERLAPQLVLVMLSNEDQAVYNGIKRLCDVKFDVATVCMQSSKVKRPDGRMQYFANVALKVNMKMGGVNHTLDANSGAWLKSASTMIMGMDVTHPTGKGAAAGAPSIVAVVASVDERFAQYPAILGLRESRVEIKDDVVDMFVSRFELYKARNQGRLPERVILFRDGVSESQFVQVRRDELPQMEKAFGRFGSYRPKLSIVVCGKRHNTRFYPTEHGNAARDGNPLPGTVVDRGITPAYEFDFFLQAHSSLKGTARPTHYFVVHDENGFKADDLQRVTNDLSYMFARATKAVSLVSPAYWADIACERGRCYLYEVLRAGVQDGDDSGVSGVGGGSSSGSTGRGNKGKGKGKAVAVVDSKAAMFARAKRMWEDGVSGPRLRDTMFYL